MDTWATNLFCYCLVVNLGVHLPYLVEGEVRDGCGIQAKDDLFFRHNSNGLHGLAVHTLGSITNAGQQSSITNTTIIEDMSNIADQVALLPKMCSVYHCILPSLYFQDTSSRTWDATWNIFMRHEGMARWQLQNFGHAMKILQNLVELAMTALY